LASLQPDELARAVQNVDPAAVHKQQEHEKSSYSSRDCFLGARRAAVWFAFDAATVAQNVL